MQIRSNPEARRPAPAVSEEAKNRPVAPETQDKLHFMRRDRNHDGALSRDEYIGGAKGHLGVKRDQEFRRYDTNGDGALSRDEYVAGRAADRERNGGKIELPRVPERPLR